MSYENVRTIIDTDVSDAVLESYYDGVVTWVDIVFSGLAITSELKDELYKWLTAHAIAITRERTTTSEAAGTAKVTYAGMYGKMLKATPYGQHVLMLDTTGTLEEYGTGTRRVTVTAL